jgi:predicted SAM-dependent methyltransferase
MKLLNFGCGSTYHEDWTNIDIFSSSPKVIEHDIRKNLPYPNEYFDACYSSHVIEHMMKNEASNVINECYRVLKPDGIIRIVIPDLELIARAYLNSLEKVVSGEEAAESDYDWMIIELLDQLVRSYSGGEMGDHLTSSYLLDRDKNFIKNRIGAEAENYWVPKSQPKSLANRFTVKKLLWYFRKIKNTLLEFLVLIVGGSQSRQSLREGLFRNSGEIHRWMYDRYSLKKLLESSGFTSVRICHAAESQIPNFNKYGLDVSGESVRKPDSLFMEALKP